MIEDVSTVLTNGLFDASKAEKYLNGIGAGKFDSFGRNVDPALGNEIQRAVLSSSKHGIGAILSEECQHGVQGDWHTIFPSPYSIAASFDRELMEDIGYVIGAEARAGGTAECWSPVCGLAREPRWGRSEEEMSEDTFLAGELVASMVLGMVGNGTRTRRHGLASNSTVAPLVKHFAVYSVPESGRNAAPAHVGRREVQETFLPVFEKAVRAGAQGAMSSYNEVDGIPTSSDRWLLTEQLREAFGFDGYVASDFGAIQGLGPGNHAVAANDSDCVRAFLNAGGSMNGHDFGNNYERLVVELVQTNRIPLSVLDKAVGNVLRVKARLGMIPTAFSGGTDSDALIDETLVRRQLGDNPEHAMIAQRASKESVVLLTNNPPRKGCPPFLPLDRTKLTKLLLIGPNGDEIRSGDYSAAGWAGGAPNGGGNIDNNNSVTILEGLKRAFPDALVTWTVGTGITGDGSAISGPHNCGVEDHGPLIRRSTNVLPGPINGMPRMTGASDTKPFWVAVQRHSLSLDREFEPTSASSPYLPDTATPKVLQAGVQGLRASYFAGKEVMDRQCEYWTLP